MLELPGAAGTTARVHVTDRSTGSTVIEWNRPDVVQGHVAEKRVAAQVDRSELSRIGAHADPSGASEPSSVGICDLDPSSRSLAFLNGGRDVPEARSAIRNALHGPFPRRPRG